MGKTATMIVVCTDDAAQSYIAQALSSGRSSPSREDQEGEGMVGEARAARAGPSGPKQPFSVRLDPRAMTTTIFRDAATACAFAFALSPSTVSDCARDSPPTIQA